MAYTPSVNFDDLTLYIGLCGTGKCTAGSHTLSNFAGGTVYVPNPAIAFTPSDVGMPIAIVGAGPVNALMPPINYVQGSLFHTTIASYVSATEVTLTDAPITGIYNTGFATVILYRPCPMVSDVASLPSDGLPFQFNSSIAPGTADTMQFSTFASLGGALGTDNPFIDRFGAPQLGMPVYLESSVTGDVFGGYIDSITTSSLPGVEGQPYCWSALCSSWMGIAKHRCVNPAQPQTFTNIDGDVVFSIVVLTYLNDDGVAVSVPSGLPQITLACPVGANIGQLLDQVVSLLTTNVTAYYWTCDPWRTFILATRTGTAAPWNVADGSDLFAGQTPYSQSIVQTHNQMANLVYAIGQNTLLNTLVANFIGNGTVKVFNTPLPVGAPPVITLNGNPQTVGILGVDTGDNWYWSQGSTAITQDAGGTTLLPSDALVVTYTPESPAIAQSPNVMSLQQRQAIEGTSGEFDYSFNVPQPILPADLLALAAAYQIEYGLPAQTVNFYTLRPGLAAGQIQSIVLAEAGINGSFLIATVQMTVLSNVLVWQYTAFGGANIGNAITALTQFINRAQATGLGKIITPTTPISAAATPVPGNFASGVNLPGGHLAQIPFPGGVQTGDLLIAVVMCNPHGPVPISDTLGNSWTLAIGHAGTGFFPNVISILWAISIGSGANSVSVNQTGSTTLLSIPAGDFDAAAPVDTTSGADGAPPTITVASANNVVVTGMALDSSAYVPTVTAPEVLVGYTIGLGPTGDSAAAQETVASAGSFTSSLTSAAVASDAAFASVSFNRLPSQAPPAQTIPVTANPQGTVTHSTGALTAGLPVLGNGGGDVKVGVSGQLVPAGGTAGQVLTKNSGTDYDVKWAAGGGGGGGGGGGYLNILPLSYSAVGQGTWVWTGDSNSWAGGYVYNSTEANGDNLSYPIWCEAGTYTVFLLSIINTNSGKIEIDIDGTAVATFDAYGGALLYNQQFTQAGISISAGAHTVKVLLAGKNASSSGYVGHLNYLGLIRTA